MPLVIAAVVMLLVSVTVGESATSHTVVNTITWFEDPGHEAGSTIPGGYAVQQRGYYSITAHLRAKELVPGHRYTLWWVIFNNTGQCLDGCDFDDVTAAVTTGQNPAAIGLQYAGAFVAPANGQFNGTVQIVEDKVAGCQNSAPFNVLCNSLIEVTVAEAMVLIRDHGPADLVAPRVYGPDAFASGCKAYTQMGAVVSVYSDTGYDCYTTQSVFLP
ncbi:MAG TPA: hypothetical protein VFS30_03265 [Dehalococcoidia bacterium]|nr:hypothetical protein [Dehalococcoidia bacterium]